MNEDQLIKLGLSEEQSASVLSMYKKSIDGNFVPKSRFDVVNDEAKRLKESNGSSADYDAEISRLTNEKVALKESYGSALKGLEIGHNVDLALSKSKAKDKNLVKRLLNMDEVKFDENNNLVGLDNQIKDLVNDESTSMLFHTKKAPVFKGAQVGRNTQNKPDGTPDFSKMSYEHINNYMLNNK